MPCHTVDAYLAKLVKTGHNMAICEQVEGPRQAKGPVKREMVRISMPGTIIKSSMLEESAASVIFGEKGDSKHQRYLTVF